MFIIVVDPDRVRDYAFSVAPAFAAPLNLFLWFGEVVLLLMHSQMVHHSLLPRQKFTPVRVLLTHPRVVAVRTEPLDRVTRFRNWANTS